MEDIDKQAVVYFGLLFLLSSCVLGGYGIYYFGGTTPTERTFTISPYLIVSIGAIFGIINSIILNIISGILLRKLDAWNYRFKYTLVGSIFAITFGGSLIIALLASR